MTETRFLKIFDQVGDGKWKIFNKRIPVPQPSGETEKPLAIISSVGDCGIGKSFLNNILLNYVTLGETCFVDREHIPCVFPVAASFQPETKGIDMYNGYLQPKVRGKTETRVVTLWDTEGHPDSNQPQDHAVTVFGLAAYFSSVLIYNFDKCFTTSNIDQMQVFLLEMRKCFGSSNKKLFQDLIIVMRNFPDDPKFGFGWKGGKKYLAYMKEKGKGNTDVFFQELEHTFRSVWIFLMPKPTGVVAEGAHSGKVGDLDPHFRDSIRILVKRITHEILQARIINGVVLKAGDLATELVKVEAKFASNEEPPILSLGNALKEKHLKRITDECFQEYEKKLQQSRGLVEGDGSRKERHNEAKQEALARFKRDVADYFIEPRAVETSLQQLNNMINTSFAAHNTRARKTQQVAVALAVAGIALLFITFHWRML